LPYKKQAKELNMSLLSITGDDWQKDVIQSSGLLLIDFWGTGCPPCETFAPVLEAFASNHEEIKVIKVNFDDAVDVAVSLGLRGIPTIYLFEDGKLLKEHTGILNEKELIAWVFGG
jgi:thioredoxin 1